MKENKFRAWDTRRKEWTDPRKVGFDPSNGRCLMDVVIMQYTGLKDENGVEIYEGDILSVYLPEIPPMDDATKKELHGVMVNPSIIHGREAQWKYYQVEDMVSLHLHIQDYGAFCLNIDEYEVVGNIYQNPELLQYDN